jgi:hypothetical protein
MMPAQLPASTRALVTLELNRLLCLRGSAEDGNSTAASVIDCLSKAYGVAACEKPAAAYSDVC